MQAIMLMMSGQKTAFQSVGKKTNKQKIACSVALKEKHPAGSVETKIAASSEKLAIFPASGGRRSSGSSNAMNSSRKRKQTKKETGRKIQQGMTRLLQPPRQTQLKEEQPIKQSSGLKVFHCVNAVIMYSM